VWTQHFPSFAYPLLPEVKRLVYAALAARTAP
jgi:hypothetical protein